MHKEWLPLLFAAGAAKRIGFGPLRENEYPAAKWMQAHTTAAAELVPASVQVDFTKGERCVLAHEGVTLRRAAQLAAADGCMAGDEATELFKRRCAVHHQPRAQLEIEHVCTCPPSSHVSSPSARVAPPSSTPARA